MLSFAVVVGSSGSLGNAKAAEVTKPTLPFHQCPAVSHDTSCGSLIVVNPDGSASLYTDFTQGPYDGEDDTLVGVENRSSQAVRGITLASTSGGASIFALDGDGFCSAGNSPASPTSPSPPSPGPNTPPAPSAPTLTCGSGSTGYEGPNVSFTVADPDNGTVNFGGAGLAPGDSTYFGLEAALTRFDLKPPQLSSPSPSALPSTSPSPSPQPTSQPSPPSPQSTDSNSSCSWNPFDKNSCEIAVPARAATDATLTVVEAPVAIGQSVVLNGLSLLSELPYGIYRGAYWVNQHSNIPVVSNIMSVLQRAGLFGDKVIDNVQQGLGYPGANSNDEGQPIHAFPSIIYPTPGGSGLWKWNQNKFSWGPMTQGPGVNPNGSEDYADHP